MVYTVNGKIAKIIMIRSVDYMTNLIKEGDTFLTGQLNFNNQKQMRGGLSFF